MGEFKTDFDEYIGDFDLEMDFQANQASYESSYKTQYQELLHDKINRRSDNNIFTRSEFAIPTFSEAGTKDINIIDEIGKIVDN